MPEVIIKDHSINEPPVAELHPLRTTPQGTQSDGVEHGHEHRDIDARAIAKWFVGLGAIILFTYLAMIGMFYVTINYEAKQDRLASPLATGREIPPEPYIEGLTMGGEVKAGTVSHLKATRAKEAKTLKNWGLAETNSADIARRKTTIPGNIVQMVAREGQPVVTGGNAPVTRNEERKIPSDASGGQHQAPVQGETIH